TENYTKGDLLEYYRAIAPWLLPYLRDRPVMLTRYPDGIDGKSFFQKDAPEWTPAWIRTEALWSQDTARDVHHFVIDDVESLLYVVNMGTIPLHIWGSRIATLERPDWCILDLDPKSAPFTDVVKVARAARKLCDEIALPSFVKTSGGSGIHVLIPLARLCTYEQCRQLGQLLAGVIVSRVPAIATVERTVAARGGRVYVDFLQNGMGKTLAAPLSARPVPGARVSMPLEWKEVTARLDASRFTIATALARMTRLGEDPFAAVLTTTPDLAAALAALHELLDRAPHES
ncbi:MAG: non-homologous end-joining DNA ligase, partial [Candidatus Binatia bacterium]